MQIPMDQHDHILGPPTSHNVQDPLWDKKFL